jgi:hypothetical protein
MKKECIRQVEELAEVFEDCGNLSDSEFASTFGWTKDEQRAYAYGMAFAAKVLGGKKKPLGLLCGMGMDYAHRRKNKAGSDEAWTVMFGDPVGELGEILAEAVQHG